MYTRNGWTCEKRNDLLIKAIQVPVEFQGINTAFLVEFRMKLELEKFAQFEPFFLGGVGPKLWTLQFVVHFKKRQTERTRLYFQ